MNKAIKNNLNIALALLPLIITLVSYHNIPISVGLFWDGSLAITYYTSRYTVLLLSALPLFYYFLKIRKQRDISEDYYKTFWYYNLIKMVFSNLFFLMFYLSIFGFVTMPFEIDLVIYAIYIFIKGLVFRNVNYNEYLGYVNKYTKSNVLVWKRTHVFISNLNIILSTILFVSTLVFYREAYLFLMVGILLILVRLVSFLYSKMLYNELVRHEIN